MGMDDERVLLKGEHTNVNSYSSVSIAAHGSDAYKQRWRSVRVMYLTMFLSSVAFSICLVSIYPFLQRLDPASSTALLGWVVASYSLGQLIASPFFGWWANRRHSTREPLMVSMMVFMAANVLYAYLQDFGNESTIFLILARSLIGFGAGNVAVVRSYVAGATNLVERTGAMANVAGAQAMGFVLGPAIQTAFVPLGYPGPVQEAWLQLNVYTAPALLSAILGVVNVLLVAFVFREFRIDPYSVSNAVTLSEPSVNSDADGESDSNHATEKHDLEHDVKPDMLAAVICIAVFFVVLFMFCIFETIATPLAMHMFDWTNEQTTFYIGFVMVGSGLLSIADFALVKCLSRRFDERRLLIFSLGLCMLGYIGYLPWGDVKPDIRPEVINHNVSFANVSNVTTMEPVGCPASYTWCFTTPKIYLWQLIICMVVFAIGYPNCNVLSYSIFSKILGPKPQGTMMGWLTAAGSLARVLGPVFVANIYEAYGPRITFVSAAAIVLSALILTVMLYKRLVPFEVHVAKVMSQRATLSPT